MRPRRGTAHAPAPVNRARSPVGSAPHKVEDLVEARISRYQVQIAVGIHVNCSDSVRVFHSCVGAACQFGRHEHPAPIIEQQLIETA